MFALLSHRSEITTRWRRVISYTTFVYIFGLCYPRWTGGGNATLGYDRTLISLCVFSVIYEVTQDIFGNYDPFEPFHRLATSIVQPFARAFALGVRPKKLKQG